MLKLNSKSRKTLILSILAFAVAVLFQNCGDSLSDTTGTSDLSSFSLSSQFDGTMPYPPKGRLINDIKVYLGILGFKAMAVAANGYGLATGSPKFISQVEADRVIQEECQLLSNNSPCGIYMEGNAFKYDPADFPKHLISAIDSGPRAFDITRVPTLLSSNSYYVDPTTYTAGTDAFKAFAIGDYGRAAHGSGETQDEADQLALQNCEGIDGTLCMLYAEGDNVVWNSTVFTWGTFYQALYFNVPAFNYAYIPFLKYSDRIKLRDQIMALPVGQHWALAVGRFQHFYLATDPTSSAATLEILSQINCNLTIPATADYSCLVYAVDGLNMWNLNDLKFHSTPTYIWN